MIDVIKNNDKRDQNDNGQTDGRKEEKHPITKKIHGRTHEHKLRKKRVYTMVKEKPGRRKELRNAFKFFETDRG